MTDAPVRPFADWLCEQSAGRTHEELSRAIRDVTAAVVDTGKAGTVSLTVKIAPLGKGDSSALVVTDVVRVSKPEHDRRKSIFYPDADGNLRRDDPNQPTFEGLREVPAPTATTVRDLPTTREAN